MATGTGKTVIFSKLPQRLKHVLPGQTVIYAHREELIDQAIDKMRAANPSLRIDKEMAKHQADPSLADVVVASVATLGRAGSKRLDKFNWENFDKHTTDEAHHSVATSYLNIYERAGVLRPDYKGLLTGFTATPQRGDGQALAKLYQKIVYTYSLRNAIEDGWLVDVRGIKVKTNISLDHIKTVAGDFEEKELASTVDTPIRNQLAALAYKQYGEGRQAIGFAVTIEHAKHLAETFRFYGINAEAVWGVDPERADKLERHRAGEISVLFNVDVLTEGYDDWHISCIIDCAPTKSPVKYTQRIGRATRLEDGTGNLLDWTGRPIKRDCLIIDVADASKRHSLITLPTLMGMASGLNLNGKSLVGAARALEEAQEKYAHLDFAGLENLDDLSEYIEKVDLFKVKFLPEVEENSEFSWHGSPTGGYILMLPPERDTNGKIIKSNDIRINQNLLDKWELEAYIKGKRYKGERDSIEAIFQAADKLVQDFCPEEIKLVKREATWHNLPPTQGQLNLLAKFFKGMPIPKDMTRGKASQLIGSKLAKKANR